MAFMSPNDEDYERVDPRVVAALRSVAELITEAADALTAQAERVRVLESALKRTHQTLCVPAAEYVPAIRDCFDIIDAALKPAP